ncbi:iron complex outermembrane receptor protein [Bradyrhizobium sp. LM6.11]
MSFELRRAQRLGGASLLLLGAAATPALAQDQPASTEIPAVTVTAPSPIVRRAVVPTRNPGRATRTARARSHERAADATPAASTPAAPQQGVLPIVTNQFATVTVVPNEEIRREGGGQLGDLLFSKPGITGSSFAPGASSRPIIRGLDVNRVGIIENGTNAGGASDLGEDHFVPIDPLATNQVEVVRGPAALRYGSTSIGGVVSATNNRIPDALPNCGAQPFQSFGLPVKAPLAGAATSPCVTAETRSAFSSVDRGVESGVLLDTGGGNYAFHADVYGRNTTDYSIPSYPYLADQTRSIANGRQPNSATRSDGGSIGGSYFFQGGYIGAAITQNDALYHIPGIDGADHNTRIDAHQTKINVKGEYHPDAAAIEIVRFWAGATDYRHNEIGLADPADPNTDGVRQTFTNKEQEIRTEVQLMPFNARFAEVTTAFGFQAGHQELTAPSPDDPGALFNGLWDPNRNYRVAGYVFNEFKFSEQTRAQIAGRIEHVELHGSTPDFPADFLPDGSPQTSIVHNPSFTPKSGSIGLLQDLPGGMVGSITAQYVERAPKPAELFSRGGHDATATFDIGNPNLTIETAKSVEIGLRKATGPFRFEATAFYTHFDNFIYRRLTGVMCDGDFASCGHARCRAEPGGLFAAECQLPRRRIPVAVRCRCIPGRHLGHREPVRRRACHLHRRHQRAADSAAETGRRRVLARRQLADARQSVARLRSEQRRCDRGDADTGLQFAEGRGQLQDQAQPECIRRARDAGRPRRQQSVEREHPQLGILHQGRGLDARHRRQGVRQLQVLKGCLEPVIARSLATKQSRLPMR